MRGACRSLLLLMTVLGFLPKYGSAGSVCAAHNGTTATVLLQTAFSWEAKDVTLQGDGDCKDQHEMCSIWAAEGECSRSDEYMLEVCPFSCQSCPVFLENEWDDDPQIAMGPLQDEIVELVRTTQQYMKEQAQLDDQVTQYCRNTNAKCSYWSLLGECDWNPCYMHHECAPACQTCDEVEVSAKISVL